MKFNSVLITGLVILLITACSLPAFASDEGMQEAKSQALSSFEESKAVLEAGGDWKIEDIERYLYNALTIIYLAKAEANDTFDPNTIRETNQDLHKLVDLGYLPYWPGDPSKDWAPLQVVDPYSGFVPNALVVELCPANYETSTHGQSCAMSINLYIYGPDEALSSLSNEIYIVCENKEWASPPQHALYGMAYYAQSDKKSAEIRAKYHKEPKP